MCCAKTDGESPLPTSRNGFSTTDGEAPSVLGTAACTPQRGGVDAIGRLLLNT